MKSETCCFTGHRILPDTQREHIIAKLEETVVMLLRSGYLYFRAGGVLGFDTLCAKTVLRLRQSYPANKTDFCSAVCFSGRQVVSKRSSSLLASQEYTRDCMFKRNRHLVDYSSTCICYLNKSTGGTPYTVGYAKKCGLQIINLAEK